MYASRRIVLALCNIPTAAVEIGCLFMIFGLKIVEY